MRLSYDQICSITQGAVRIEQRKDGIHFFRFTEAEQKMYRRRREESYLRGLATAGIRLEFETDSTALTFAAEIRPSTSRRWFAHSFFADGEKIGEITGEIPDGAEKVCVQKDFELKAGKKRVTILLPWSVESGLQELCLSDGAWIAPVRKSFKLLSFGDSITQGYDAEKPENAYIIQLANALNAELISKAIGGERFCPQIAELCEITDPDLIMVSYGSNDWSLSDKDEFLRDSARFFRILADKFPHVPIVALAPIWRGNLNRQTSVGEFSNVAAHLQSVAAGIEAMTVIDCIDFVPHDSNYFRDLVLHPNDAGFAHYASALIPKVKEILSSRIS